MDLKKVFTPAAIAANWTEVASNQIPYLGSTLFPARKKAGLDLSWLKGSRGLPISLMPSAFDAKATFRDRIGFDKIETEMPFFREGFKIKERDRQELLRVQESTDPYAAEVLNLSLIHIWAIQGRGSSWRRRRMRTMKAASIMPMASGSAPRSTGSSAK